MASKLDICNLALSRFGQGYISDVNADTESARLLSLNYDQCLRESLQDFAWPFAAKIQALATSAEKVDGWAYVYSYPANCAKVLRVFPAGGSRAPEKEKWEEYTTGTVILIACDIPGAYAKYTYIVADPTLYPPLFTKALSYKLASEVATSLASSQKGVEMYQRYQLAIGEAQLAGATEGHTPPVWPNSYLTGRRCGYNGH